MKHDKTFEEFLKHSNLSQDTQTSYLWTVDYFKNHYDSFSKENLLAYKGFLLEYFKPKTVNLRLQGINKYLQYIHKEELQLKFVKVQQKNFLENVISNADYQFLKTQLKKDNNPEWYFVVWFLAATGARVSELVQIKVEHVKLGYYDIYAKGGKIRRLYIPLKLKNETLKWLNQNNRDTGYLFLNRFGDKITTRGISIQLKKLAVKYGINPVVLALIGSNNSYQKLEILLFFDIY
jgi:integrase